MVNVRLLEAGALSQGNWQDMQRIAHEAFRDSISNRPESYIDALVHWDDPDRYEATRRNPNELVGNEFSEDQEFARPHLAIAYNGNDAIGYLYAADNVSGATERERRFKQLMVVKNYLWLREIAVLPEHQGRGVAHQLGHVVLGAARALQPVSAYVWPDETPGIDKTLGRYGFVKTHEKPAQPFGDGSAPVRQVRMRAKSVRRVKQKLES